MQLQSRGPWFGDETRLVIHISAHLQPRLHLVKMTTLFNERAVFSLGIASTHFVAALLVTTILGRAKRLATTDWLIVLWLVYDVIVHVTLVSHRHVRFENNVMPVSCFDHVGGAICVLLIIRNSTEVKGNTG